MSSRVLHGNLHLWCGCLVNNDYRYYKFTYDCQWKRIRKIGHHLTKIQAKVVSYFLIHSVHTCYAGITWIHVKECVSMLHIQWHNNSEWNYSNVILSATVTIHNDHCLHYICSSLQYHSLSFMYYSSTARLTLLINCYIYVWHSGSGASKILEVNWLILGLMSQST